MPRVRMITLSAGPAGCRHPGEVVEVSKEEGQALVAARSAVWADRPRRESATTGAPENATRTTKPPTPRGAN